jgi:hypothetical protein
MPEVSTHTQTKLPALRDSLTRKRERKTLKYGVDMMVATATIAPGAVLFRQSFADRARS